MISSTSAATSIEPLDTSIHDLSNPQVLLTILQSLRQTVESEGETTFNKWRSGASND
jgi:pyruvate kinase